MNIKLIVTEQDYNEAMARIDALMDLDPEENSIEDIELNALALLIEQYEDKHYKIDLSSVSAIDVVKFRMEQNGLDRKAMQEYLGTSSRVSEVLNGKRPLSLNMIKKLNKGLNIPAELLISG